MHLRHLALAAATALGFASTAFAVELNPAAVTFKTPDQFKWRDPTDQAQTNQTILLGDPKFRGFVGENSAAQYFTPGTRIDPDKFARGFLEIWLKSPDHKMNLTYPRFDKTGIGIAIGGNTIYAAELFATDLGLPEPQ